MDLSTLPKVELHLHLEGSITQERWLSLRKKNHPHAEVLSAEDISNKYRFSSFLDFLNFYAEVLGCLKEPEDFYLMAKDLAENLVKQNILYAEVFYTPWLFTRKGIDFFEMMEAIDQGFQEVESQHDVSLKLLFDGPRNFGHEVVRTVFEQAAADKTNRVLGVGLGGDEKNHPAEWFAGPFNWAGAQGLKKVAHAGETAGEGSIYNAVKILGASRIGHALGIQDQALKDFLKEQQVTLDLCPGSNMATRVISSLREHPFKTYYDEGLSVTLNSDDPVFFGTSLVKEFETISQLHHLETEDIVKLVDNAIEGSFAELTKKEELRSKLNQWFKDQNRTEP